MRGSATSICLLFFLGFAACCSVNNVVQLQGNELLGTWYEIESYEDPLMAIFCKCIKNDVTAGAYNGKIQKTRSYKLKFFPFFTLRDTTTVVNKGTTWSLESNSWLGSSQDLGVVAKGTNYLVLKTCPNAWFTDERIWVYSKTKELQRGDVDAINKALAALNEPQLSSFRTVTQSC